MDKQNRWISIEYCQSDIGGVKGLTGSIHSGSFLFELLERHRIQRQHIISFMVDDKLQSKEEIDKIFDWQIKKEREMRSIEERKKTK